MKTLLKLTLLLFVLNLFQSCSKDDASAPVVKQEPDAIPEPEPEPENKLPTQAVLLSPVVDAINIDVKPTFSWEAATDADGDTITYEIYADTTSTPNTLIGTTTDTTLELEERLPLLETLNWKVVAKDGNGGESESEINSFGTRTVITSNATTSAQFGERGGHSSVVFNDKVWVIGGRLGNGNTVDTNEVWNSDDGVNWNLVTASANFAPRYSHQSLVFDNKIWVIGGIVGTESTKEVWNSEDGINWVQESAGAGYQGCCTEKAIVFDNKMWMINNEVWFSEDGVVWSLAYDDMVIRGSLAVYNNKLYAVGGSFELEVFVSNDGFEWTLLESNSSELFQNHTDLSHNVIVFDEKLWNIGGFDNNVLYTKDGINWEIANDSPAFSALFFHTTAIKDNKIWVIGGYGTGSNNAQDDVWFIN